MVRHKTRWLFIQVDFSSENTVVSKGELLSSIRENILRCGGDTAYSYVNEIQIRFLDPMTRTAMLRVPRSACNFVRAAITCMTQVGFERVAISTLRISGGGRTAKMAAMRILPKLYQRGLRQPNLPPEEVEKLEKGLEQCMSKIRSI